jgi:hypothetical protein
MLVDDPEINRQSRQVDGTEQVSLSPYLNT